MNIANNAQIQPYDSFTKDVIFVVIVASSDNLKSLYKLFLSTIPNDVAIIVVLQNVQNIPQPLVEDLELNIKRKVTVITENMQVLANMIYLHNEISNVEIKNGFFKIIKSDSGDINFIDLLLNSISEECNNKCIAVILSGKENRFYKGIDTIKNGGGLIITEDFQAVDSAEIINANNNNILADFILKPSDIMSEISEFIKNSSLYNQFKDNDEDLLRKVLVLISNHTPLDFQQYKRATIIRRIIKKMNQHSFVSLLDYIVFLKNNPSEIDALSKQFMISVTRFFRDPEVFDYFLNSSIPEILEKKPPLSLLKIWCVGCATGEEAYTLAILIHEKLLEMNLLLEVKIFATDIDKEALSIASKGKYSNKIVQDISSERLIKYFNKDGDSYRVKDAIRSMLIFAQHDITKNPPYYKIDIISCRNLLIYLNPELQNKILSTLQYCLNLGGILVLGSSENIGKLKTKFIEKDSKLKIYKNIESSARLENGTYSTPIYFTKKTIKPLPVISTVSTPSDKMQEMILEAIANKTKHAGVCIDKDFKIVNTFGDYKKFLLQEMFNFNLLQILPEELSIVTASGVRQVLQENKELTIYDVLYIQNKVNRNVTIFIKQLTNHKDSDNILMVSFNESTTIIPQENYRIFNRDEFKNQYCRDLEAQLLETQKKVQEGQEALQLLNLNAEAFNEELISGNEELQSTNEEVQSINEELQTVNNEFQSKIKELAELNDDLNNYFKSTVNGHLYVDKNLIVRKFTPAAFKQINLKETDIGRYIGDISSNIRFSTMIEDMYKVLGNSEIIEKEIQTKDNKWYQMVLHPYVRDHDKKTDGIIVSFNNITDLKLAQKKLIKINMDHDTFIYSVSHDLNAPVSNIVGLLALLNPALCPIPEEMKEVIELINNSVSNLKNIIFELSDITKISNESADNFTEAVRFEKILEEIKSSIQELIINTNSKIIFEFDIDEVTFSSKNMRSILLNLINNAIKYRSPDRDAEIKLSTEQKDNYIILIVEDNGMGIHKDKLPHIFSLFSRAHTEDSIEGSGVGLYLVKKIMGNAKGKISVKSEVGIGTIFKLYFKIK